jgi:hypothetical protein
METSANSSPAAIDNLPYPRSYWADPGKLLAGCYPGSDIPTHAEEKLNGLLRCGVSCVINLMEEDETDHSGRSFIPYESHLATLARHRGASMVFHRLPIVDMDIPTVAGMQRILETIDSAVESGQVVYVHCWGGRGRTGTVIGCHLLRHRLVPDGGALDHLTALTQHQCEEFWPTPQTSEQRQFVSDWRYGL